jgi:hypothetical protein
MDNSLYIEKLKELVEKKYGRELTSSADFERFSEYLGSLQQHTVSASTLKRMWGYVADEHQARTATLDTLAAYLGFKHFSHFCAHEEANTPTSGFVVSEQIQSENLRKGDELEIGWAPERRIHLRYDGDYFFTVLKAENSLLQQGDRFKAVSFISGEPLHLPYLIRDGKQTEPFIAGRNGGLSFVKKLI